MKKILFSLVLISVNTTFLLAAEIIAPQKIDINDRWDIDGSAINQIVKLNAIRLRPITGLRLINSIEFNYSADFLKLNPSIKIVELNKKLEELIFVGIDNCFYRSISGKLTNGSITPKVIEAFDGESIQTMELTSDPTMIINRINWRLPHGAMTGKNPFLEIYAFLNDDLDPGTLSNIIIADIKSESKWQAYREKIIGVKKTFIKNVPVFVLKSGIANKTIELVYFDEVSGSPLVYERYTADGIIVRRVSVITELSTTESKTLRYPLNSEIVFYLNGWRILTNKITNRKFQVNPSLKERSIFNLDPAEATSIWDSDNKRRIEIPN